MVRWVDFIPESDVELKRQMPEASKADPPRPRRRRASRNTSSPTCTRRPPGA
jgi:hypothetical protein